MKYKILRQITTQTDKVTPFFKASVFTPFFAEK
nr:MAG TPA: DASH complex subunit Dad3 [Caudoviricetes sp.]